MKTSHIIILISTLFIASCTKYKEDFIGPKIAIADEGNFAFIETFSVEDSMIDLSKKVQRFKGKFSQEVNWTIKLTGQKSKAEYQISGTSSSVSDSIYSWDGSSDFTNIIKIFDKEKVTAELSILGLSKKETVEFQVENTYQPNFLLSNFDDNSSFSNWFTSIDETDEFSATNITNDPTVPQGTGYVKLVGKDNSNDFFTGNFGVNNVRPYDQKATNDDFYFNLFVKGNGSTNTSQLEIQFAEFYGDTWVKKVPLDFDGWKYISFPYSELTTNYSKDLGAGASGAGIKEANLINSISMLSSAVPSGGNLQIQIDYPCITLGRPLIQNKN